MFNDDCEFSPSSFSGKIRLFPLPDLVLFPHVMQPLHIFEPRYREMLEAALESDQLIGMSLLAEGWENDYDNTPNIEPVICVSQVLSHSKLEDGRYNILVAGVHRAKLVRELPMGERSFREAEAVLVEDHYGQNSTTKRNALKRELIEKLRTILPKQTEGGHLDDMLTIDASLGVLTDVLAFALPLTIPMKQQLLSEPDVDSRARILVRYIDSVDDGNRPRVFPPNFSSN